MTRPKTAGAERYRRSRALALSWTDDGVVGLDCRTGARMPISREVFGFLDAVGHWTTARALASTHPEVGREADVRRVFRALERHGLVERESAAVDWAWHDWMPDAAAFHFATRGGRYPRDPLAHDRRLRLKALHSPPPPPTKATTGRSILLPRQAVAGDLSAAALERRTWRVFGKQKVPLDQLAALLHLTWGVQKWGKVKGQGDVAFKTSPSGGARHPIEAYVLARHVAGLRRGTYHYDAARHHLVDLGRGMSGTRIERLLAHQHYFADAGAVIVMTAVFERTMWRYPSSRAYRSILIEAGHLGQMFCLGATALGLAPFATMAFYDPDVDRLLRIDGINEGSVYIVGVGTKPAGAVVHPGRIRRRRRR